MGGTASLEGSRCTSSGAFSSVLATPETSRPHRKRDLVLYPAWADASSVTPRGRRERVMAVARLRLHLAVAGPLQFSGRIWSWPGWPRKSWLMSPAFLENTKNAGKQQGQKTITQRLLRRLIPGK